MNGEVPQPRPNVSDFQDTAWVSGAFRPLLIALVAASVCAGPLAVIRALAPWPLSYALPLIFVATLEGAYSTLRLGRPQWRDRRGALFRTAEIAVLVAMLRIAVWAFSLGFPGPADWAQLLRHPDVFFDTQFVIVGLLIIGAWGMSVSITSDFIELGIQADEFAAHEVRGWGESRSHLRVFRPTSRSEVVRMFAFRWIWGGVLTVLCAALSRTRVGAGADGVISAGISHTGLQTDVLVALLCYFLAGLLLLSQARLAILRGRWYNEGIIIAPNVVRTWHRNSLVTLIVIAAIAALLPLGSASALATIVEMLIAFVVQLGYVLLVLLLVVFSVLLYPFRFLTTGRPAAPAPLPYPTVPSREDVLSQLPDWLGGALYWIVVLLVAGYLLAAYLRAHGLLDGHWPKWLSRLWFGSRARWARVRAATRFLAARLGMSERRQNGSRRGSRARSPDPDSLRPAARIRFFYLNTIRRAAEQGVARKSHQTPLEFESELTTQWPDTRGDVDLLTGAFLAARYDRRPIPDEKAIQAKSIWRRLVQALRKPAGDRDRT